jgi:predicted nucleic acid-binding protein
VVLVDMDLVGEAVDCSILNRLSFWDALIVVAAEKAGCAEVWTEDMNEGQTIRGVKLHNPFRVR